MALIDSSNSIALMSSIVPRTFVVVEQQGTFFGEMLVEEARALGSAVPTRRAEFAAGRTCARAALRLLGGAPGPILRGHKREPIWPSGVVGSITHTSNYCCAAVGWNRQVLSIGIDAEVDEELPEKIWHTIACKEEIEMLDRLTPKSVNWGKVLFSAKESLFKAWYPVMRSWLGFEQARVKLDPETGHFSAQICKHPTNLQSTCAIQEMTGKFKILKGLILTSVSIPRAPNLHDRP